MQSKVWTGVRLHSQHLWVLYLSVFIVHAIQTLHWGCWKLRGKTILLPLQLMRKGGYLSPLHLQSQHICHVRPGPRWRLENIWDCRGEIFERKMPLIAQSSVEALNENVFNGINNSKTGFYNIRQSALIIPGEACETVCRTTLGGKNLHRTAASTSLTCHH